jgi:sialic acid synthase
MVTDIRRMEACLGSPNKRLLASERPCHQKLGKSVVAARNLEAGAVLSRQDLTVKV